MWSSSFWNWFCVLQKGNSIHFVRSQIFLQRLSLLKNLFNQVQVWQPSLEVLIWLETIYQASNHIFRSYQVQRNGQDRLLDIWICCQLKLKWHMLMSLWDLQFHSICLLEDGISHIQKLFLNRIQVHPFIQILRYNRHNHLHTQSNDRIIFNSSVFVSWILVNLKWWMNKLSLRLHC